MVKVVIVSTSAPLLKGVKKTGVWLEELAAPYYIFKDAGYDIVLASILGGPIPIDAGSMGEGFFTEPSKKLMHDPEAIDALSHSVPINTIDFASATDIDVLYLPGGHGTCVDFINCPALKSAIETMLFAQNKIVASVCHGPIGLCDCMEPDGKTPLVAGKKVAGFSDSEESVVDGKELVPFLLETKLKELGAKYEKADDWNSKVCIDGKLITGQNPQSSVEAAQEVVKMLS